jgi:hypothetical protein
MEPVNWKSLLGELEAGVASLKGERAAARDLQQRVQQALQQAESAAPDGDVMNRLDLMLMVLTERSRENVCTNAKCPHYNKKCKMR